ncbi:MAG: tRNA (N6-isopentenyl adenosine(37)-C2)-methylthiotransferase MiaB [Chitinispirillia bacterium]|nr:tRNA (N6-isopentenyl adenosine(37)-C2)-methylthiotransferase MiaB [Chitinispirillia bacterium]MCL2268441.1 tRNA (N6-isopentenyl adenosine(37)-C2)-methylthiotransferase MiaB [Chitinispirillia bacterium]
MPSVYFQTFGCQMNTADSDAIYQLLAQRGFVLNDSCVGSDLIIVNTCSVREAAEKRALARIAEFANGKKNHPGQKLWVIGCMAERLGDALKKDIPGIDNIIGAKQMERIDDVIESQFPKCQGDDKTSSSIFQKTAVTDFVPVMRGCDNYCAYCVVPYVRGREMSVPYDVIESAVKQKVGAGIREITFLGQNVNSYNHGGIDFPELLSRMAGVDGLERIRFTTSHPKDCTGRLIDVMASSPKIAAHLHLPFQAGSDRILALMNRRYTASQYRGFIDTVKKRVPGVDLTSDIMVGFPSETDAEFRETLALVRDIRFTAAFMFAYSPREGTAAALMREGISKAEKLARLSELIALQTEITREIYEKSVGEELEVLVTGRQQKRDRAWMGQDRGCKRVLISCEEGVAGMIFKVRAVKSSGMTLIAERVGQ